MSTEFVVKARSRTGQLVTSKMKAASEADAVAAIRREGMTPISVNARTGLNLEFQLTKPKVKLKDLAVFSRQFATMLSSGLPILRCLTILSQQVSNPTLRTVLTDVTKSVEGGDSLSEAMAKHKQFPPIMIAMIRAGETGGFLDTTMLDIAASFEADAYLRGKIKAALTYPIAVGVIAIVIVIAMLIFVVPVFEEMFASFGAGLPAPTQVLVNLSTFIKTPYISLPIVVVIVGLIMWYRRHKTDLAVRRVVDPIRFKIPVFGQLFQKVALARFARNFSTLMAAGVPVLTALDIVGDTAGNLVITNAVASVKESVRQGQSMAVPLSQHKVFPEMVVQMIAVGEDTGALDAMLAKIADFYDQEAAATTEQLMALLEPVMIVCLGGIVGGMIVALYLPIFQIFEVVNQ